MIGNFLLPGGNSARLSIAIYHRVIPNTDEFVSNITEQRFRWELTLFKKYFNVLPLSDAIRQLHEGTLPPRSLCITFDDGYADNATNALPILQEFGFHATFFIATGFLNGGMMWNDKLIEALRSVSGDSLNLAAHDWLPGSLQKTFLVSSLAQRQAALAEIIGVLKYEPMEERLKIVNALCDSLGYIPPNDFMMTDAQLTQLSNAGMTIGAHTVNHPILAKISDASARKEIADGRDYLQSLIQKPISLFAYPNGKPGQDYLKQHVDMVKDLGFEAAVSTSWGVSTKASDVFQLPRFTPWDQSKAKYLMRMYRNGINVNPAVA